MTETNGARLRILDAAERLFAERGFDATPTSSIAKLLNLARRLSELQQDSAVLRVIIWREQRTHPDVRARLHEHRNQVQAVVERVLRGSVLRPIAARALHAAAAAWVAILTVRPFADHQDAADAAPDLPALAELICAGLDSSQLA